MIPANLTEGTSANVQKILEAAFKIADERKHRTVSPSHVMMALLLSPCRAQQMLGALLRGTTYDNLQKDVDASIEPGTKPIDGPHTLSPKVDSIFKRASLLARNLGASGTESLHLLLSFLLENDCNPKVLLTEAGITTSAIILEGSMTLLPESRDSQCDSQASEGESIFPRLVALLSAGGAQPTLLRDFIILCEKNGRWKEELLRPFQLFAAAQMK